MTKICHVTSVHDCLDTRIFYKECVSLAKAGYETYLVAAGKSFDKDGVHIVGVGERKGGRLKPMFLFSYKVIRKGLELDCDIYHLHDPELLPYALYLKRKGKKVIFDSHENYTLQIAEKTYINKFLRKISSKLYYVIETFVTKRIDIVIVPCTFNEKNIFEGRAKNTTFLDNYPLMHEFYDRYEGYKHSNNQICYLGTLTEGRGVTDNINAAIKSRTKLVLAGKISLTYENKLKKINGYNEFVSFLGNITREEVYSVYSKSSIGIFTLHLTGQYGKADNFGIKVLEFMAMGLPIIVTQYNATKKLLNEYSCGLAVEGGNIKEIADAILYLQNNPDIAKQMGENGRRAVREKYNWGMEEKKLLNLYEELIV